MWGNFFKRKQRDDDEFALISGYNLSGHSSVVRTQIHDSILTGEQYVSEVLKGHELACKREFRMKKAIFHKLVDLLRERNLLQDTRVTVEEQVAIFMYAVSKNASNRDRQWRFQHSGETISRHFGIVLRAMVSLSTSLYSCQPVIFVGLYWSNRWNTHFNFHSSMSIRSLPKQKGTLSQNVMVACNFDNQFVHVSAGWEGSASDVRVLQDALQNGARQKQPMATNSTRIIQSETCTTP
ncbi:hypothetical protein U9M48_012082 [Paspalum notatum var. saurae]|uniref:DUF8040 domain-containing protein n=1 Tax=Paspalum notatum var. saurae TaxID=547442 RepID=A0AAQ3WI80_PASNO